LAEEARATEVWLVETAAFGRSMDEVSSAGDWLVKTAAPGSRLEDVGPCASGDDVPHKLMSPIIDTDKSYAYFGPTSLGYPSSKRLKSISG
jgi:hypothetical protein